MAMTLQKADPVLSLHKNNKKKKNLAYEYHRSNFGFILGPTFGFFFFFFPSLLEYLSLCLLISWDLNRQDDNHPQFIVPLSDLGFRISDICKRRSLYPLFNCMKTFVFDIQFFPTSVWNNKVNLSKLMRDEMEYHKVFLYFIHHR